MRKRTAAPLDLLLSNLLSLRRQAICRRQFERYLGHALRVAFEVPGDPRAAPSRPQAAPRIPCTAPRRGEGSTAPSAASGQGRTARRLVPEAGKGNQTDNKGYV